MSWRGSRISPSTRPHDPGCHWQVNNGLAEKQSSKASSMMNLRPDCVQVQSTPPGQRETSAHELLVTSLERHFGRSFLGAVRPKGIIQGIQSDDGPLRLHLGLADSQKRPKDGHMRLQHILFPSACMPGRLEQPMPSHKTNTPSPRRLVIVLY